ncbi:MAG TPA: hypothetical protein VF779_10010 [Pyrinomonadaceae bacterium]
METLVPSEAYDIDETGYRQRMPLVNSIAFGLPNALLALIFAFPEKAAASWGLAIFTFWVCGGFVVGLLNGIGTVLFRTKVAPSIEAIYNGTSGLAVLPPSDKEYVYQVPCLWMKFGHLEVSGVLYIGREDLLFMPHSHQDDSPQLEKPLKIDPPERVSLGIVKAQLDFFHRILHRRVPNYLEIRWGNRRELFAVPQVEQTKEKIERAIVSLGGKYLGASRVESQKFDVSEGYGVKQEAEVRVRTFDKDGLTPLERALKDEDER